MHAKIEPYVWPKVYIAPERPRSVALSSRQFGQLRAIMEAPRGTIGLEDLASYNQHTVGANRRRKWIAEKNSGHAIGITPEGKEALRAFSSGDFHRKVASTNFSSYLAIEPPDALTRSLKKRNSTKTLAIVPRGKVA